MSVPDGTLILLFEIILKRNTSCPPWIFFHVVFLPLSRHCKVRLRRLEALKSGAIFHDELQQSPAHPEASTLWGLLSHWFCS